MDLRIGVLQHSVLQHTYLEHRARHENDNLEGNHMLLDENDDLSDG
jgi:hypothetical protein